MAAQLLPEDFLLQTKTARRLYHDHAAKMPIYDYHCHLPVGQIASDHNFLDLTQAWLAGDHYKWRAMRANGVPEKYITGDADSFEKFRKWGETVPYTLRNPLYHWTALELQRYFGVKEPLNGETARAIYDKCREMLRRPEFSVRGLLKKMNVKLICTTEGPLENLAHHRKIHEEAFEIKVHAALRPDVALAKENTKALRSFVEQLGQAASVKITGFCDYLEALQKRHDFFHENGCRLSDYGLEAAFADDYTDSEIEKIFKKIRDGKTLDESEVSKFNSAVMLELATMHAKSGWVMQLHLGALRNANSTMVSRLGPDTGYDSIGDLETARPLAKFLDRLASRDLLPKTILYNLNPAHNAVMATMAGNFQEGTAPGKIQWGSAWWFLDQKRGIEEQLNTLSEIGLLRRFVGMLTDSRSFLSFPRHEYFRRILCNLLGNDVETGLIPDDTEFLVKTVEDICYNNAKEYFDMQAD